MKLIGSWTGFAVLLVSSTGCLSHRPIPVPIKVIDAETKAPVAGAEVHLWNPDTRGPSPGKNSSGVTGPNGIALVCNESSPEEAIVIEVRAPGYWSEQADFKASPPTIEGQPPVENVIAIFSGKRPSVEFLLPPGFRGMIKADLKIQDSPQQFGQREFSVPVPANGIVQITGSPILKYASGPTFRAKFATGEPVPTRLSEMQVGLRWLQVVGDTHYFVVGTQADWNDAHATLVPDAPSRPRGGSRGTPSEGRQSGRHVRGGGR